MNQKRLLIFGLTAILLMAGAMFVMGRMSEQKKGPEISLEYAGTQILVKAQGRDLLSDSKNSRRTAKPKIFNRIRGKSFKLANNNKLGAKKPKKNKKPKKSKKKAKKKKKPKAKKADPIEEEDVDLDPVEDPEDNADNSNNNILPAPVGAPPINAGLNDEERQVNEWVNIFTLSPTKDNLIAFLKEHQDGEISDETFYAVIEELLKSDQVDVAKIGLELLEFTPSVKSFVMLADYTVREGVSGEQIRLAQKSIGRFSYSGSFKILKEVLSSSSSETAVVYASQNIRVVVDRLVAQSNRDPEQRISTLNVKKKELKELIDLIPLLEDVIQEANNDQITLSLNQTIRTIQDSVRLVPFSVEVSQAELDLIEGEFKSKY